MPRQQSLFWLLILLLGHTACVKSPETNNNRDTAVNQSGQQAAAPANPSTPANPTSAPNLDPEQPQRDPHSSNTTTDLLSAAANGNTILVTALLDAGADVNAKDASGTTALMSAASNGHTETVQALLAQGANVKARDNAGKTALDYATSKGHEIIAQLLKAAEAME